MLTLCVCLTKAFKRLLVIVDRNRKHTIAREEVRIQIQTLIGDRAHNLAWSQRFYKYISMFPLCSELVKCFVHKS